MYFYSPVADESSISYSEVPNVCIYPGTMVSPRRAKKGTRFYLFLTGTSGSYSEADSRTLGDV